MKWKNQSIILIAFVFLFSLTFVSAETYAQNSDIDLKISCIHLNCTTEQTNITIVYPNSSIAIDNNATTLGNGFVNFTFSDTSSFGDYKYFTNNGYENSFLITPSGSEFTSALSIPLFLPMIFITLISVFFFFLVGFTGKREYKLTFLIFGGFFLILVIAFGIIASREVLYAFPLLYGFVNSFYRIFIISLQVLAIIVPVIVMFFVIKRAFDSRGYNIK